MLLHFSVCQLGIFRFPSWRSLALVPGRFLYDLWKEYSVVLGLETQCVPQRPCDRFPDRSHRLPRSLWCVSCFFCRSVCLLSLPRGVRHLVCSLFCFEHRVERGKAVNYHCFSQSPRLFDSSTVHGPSLGRSVSTPGPGSTWKSPTMTVVSADLCVPLHGFVHLLNMVICTFRVGEVYAWWWLSLLITRITTIICSLMYFVHWILRFHFSFVSIPTPCLTSTSPAPIYSWPQWEPHTSVFSGLHVLD